MTNISDQTLDEELGKFFELHCSLNRSIEMWSGKIDKYWHEILGSSSYEEFCIKNCGRMVEHDRSEGYGEVSWIADYEARFGTLPKVWFLASDGTFDQHVYDEYARTGRIVASWDCGPVMPDSKKKGPAQPASTKESEKPARAPQEEHKDPKDEK
ncbi:hypothetical protein [Agrobacterium tumefaciens]|uniref:hypothetical protein n=1 Tax=Agrobacterium tumefaciens TaxID=358 RepID=UPI0039A6FDD1